MFILGKIEKKCKGNKIEKKNKSERKQKINLKLINYIYVLLQIHCAYFKSFI